MLSDDQIRTFARSGWLVVRDVVGPDALRAADEEVQRLQFDEPPPDGLVGPHFYWRTAEESPGLFAPVDGARGGRVLDLAGELADGRVGVAFDQAQVALNVPPYDHRPGRPHLDGYAPDRSTPATFSLLAGLLLTDQASDDGGNLWVWPGTHLTHARFFARHGPGAFAASGGYPDVELPRPLQVHGRRGDVLIAHYLLGHNIGGNTADGTRRAVYWRLQVDGHDGRWADCLADPWLELGSVRRHLA